MTMINNNYKKIINSKKKVNFFNKLKNYVYVYCKVDTKNNNKKTPIYIGVGKGLRCLSHLKELNKKTDTKLKLLKELDEKNLLTLDILAHGLDKDQVLTVESACIDLIGIENLENKQKGHGDNVKRIPIDELYNQINKEYVNVLPEHSGVAILINRDYRAHFDELQTFEITRGVWRKSQKTIAENINAKLAYAVHNGVVKEVYEIHNWVPAGTQQYFTRDVNERFIKNLPGKEKYFEFVGRKASDKIRERYKGKIVNRIRSYGNSFVKI